MHAPTTDPATRIAEAIAHGESLRVAGLERAEQRLTRALRARGVTAMFVAAGADPDVLADEIDDARARGLNVAAVLFDGDRMSRAAISVLESRGVPFVGLVDKILIAPWSARW